MIKFKNDEKLVYAGHDILGNEKKFTVAKFANPETYELIKLFISRDFNSSLLNAIPVGQPVLITLESSEFNGRTTFNLVEMEPIKVS